jgi:hypothetical protein
VAVIVRSQKEGARRKMRSMSGNRGGVYEKVSAEESLAMVVQVRG